MPITHQTRRRFAALAGLCSALALAGATNVAAYPVTPEGENLYADAGATQLAPAAAAGPAAMQRPSTPTEPLPDTTFASSGTDWRAVVSVVVAGGLVALAAFAVASVLNGHRRRSARAHG